MSVPDGESIKTDTISFPPPKIFTNALLGSHEITSLIRDTETHERALYSLDPNAVRGQRKSGVNGEHNLGGERPSGARKSIYAHAPPSQPRSVVARVLGPDLLYDIRQSSSSAAREKGSVNVEVLLTGAERLSEVYHVEGALEKIALLRQRNENLSSSITEYQQLVSQQQSKLNRYNTGSGFGLPDDDDQYQQGVVSASSRRYNPAEVDIEAEEAEIRELEARKKALEERVAGLGTDLAGLLR